MAKQHDKKEIEDAIQRCEELEKEKNNIKSEFERLQSTLTQMNIDLNVAHVERQDANKKALELQQKNQELEGILEQMAQIFIRFEGQMVSIIGHVKEENHFLAGMEFKELEMSIQNNASALSSIVKGLKKE